MNSDTNNSKSPRNKRAIAGLFLIAMGAIYLISQIGWFLFPSWLFSWPMILIVIGIMSGLKHNFRNPASYIAIAIGGVFLIGHIIHIALYYFLWPVILIAIGVRLLTKNDDSRWCRERWERRSHWNARMHHDTNL